MFDVKRHPLNYYDSVINARLADKPIEEGKIIFYGSSGFTRWSEKWGNPNVEDVILGKNGEKVILNHAFGGSTLEEQLYYYPKLIRPFKPKALVFSGFGNDWNFGYGLSEMMMLFSRLFEYARTDMPGIKLFLTNRRANAKYVQNDPHVPYEERSWDKGAWLTPFNETNAALEEYCRLHDDTTFIDFRKFTWLYDEGHLDDMHHVRKELFVEDNVHFNNRGYALLAEEMKKVLADLL